MNRTQFIEELISGEVPIHGSAMRTFLHEYLIYLDKGTNASISQEPEKLKVLSYNSSITPIDNSTLPSAQKQKVVAVIPIRGMITRFGTWTYWGADEYERMIDEAYTDESVAAVILDIHCPGGSTHAMPVMKNVLLRKNKPVIAAVDNMAFSAAYYFALFADKIVAIDDMSEVGSIGVMASLVDDREALSKYGYKILEIYPPESNWKNRDVREALDGKPELLISEGLSPWAQHYQETVKANRKNLKLDVEGLLNGKTFYAKDALNYGLIDQILPLDKIIRDAFQLSTRQQLTNTII